MGYLLSYEVFNVLLSVVFWSVFIVCSLSVSLLIFSCFLVECSVLCLDSDNSLGIFVYVLDNFLF